MDWQGRLLNLFECRRQDIELRFMQPGKPDQYAYIERFNRTASSQMHSKGSARGSPAPTAPTNSLRGTLSFTSARAVEIQSREIDVGASVVAREVVVLHDSRRKDRSVVQEARGEPSARAPVDPAEAERCKVPEYARAMGHEEKWKLHNNCQ